jgi:hypothetical protein
MITCDAVSVSFYRNTGVSLNDTPSLTTLPGPWVATNAPWGLNIASGPTGRSAPAATSA